MKNRIIAIADCEATYASGLADYFNNKSSIFFTEMFTNEDSILEYANGEYIDILLVSDRMNLELIDSKNIGLTILISEQEAILSLKKLPAVYKYQAAGSILKQVMNFYAEREDEPFALLNKQCKLIGVYSPVRRSLKTSFCLALGQIMAKEKAVLYLNLEEYSGFSVLFQREYKADLSDVIYYLRQDKSNLLVKLEGIVESVNNLDYIPPVSSPMDIRAVKKEEWIRLIREISTNSKYNVVIIDFGDGADGLLELLNECNQVYVPVREDYLSVAKMEQFESLLSKTGYDKLAHEIKKIKLPYHNSFGSRECYAEQLVWSELGDFVRGIAR